MVQKQQFFFEIISTETTESELRSILNAEKSTTNIYLQNLYY